MSRRAMRVAKARYRREQLARLDRSTARAFARLADVRRSTAAERRRRAQAEALKQEAAA